MPLLDLNGPKKKARRERAQRKAHEKRAGAKGKGARMKGAKRQGVPAKGVQWESGRVEKGEGRERRRRETGLASLLSRNSAATGHPAIFTKLSTASLRASMAQPPQTVTMLEFFRPTSPSHNTLIPCVPPVRQENRAKQGGLMRAMRKSANAEFAIECSAQNGVIPSPPISSRPSLSMLRVDAPPSSVAPPNLRHLNPTKTHPGLHKGLDR
ncbi:hypothetical protein BJ546DRAFT_464416 [Cryomyces antarcticus]